MDGYYLMCTLSRLKMAMASKWSVFFCKGCLIIDGLASKPLHAYVLQVVIVSNHMNGKDTHVRGLRIFGPLEWVLICWTRGST
jgi:Anaphase-promoting complex, subunit 10 (APC10)